MKKSITFSITPIVLLLSFYSAAEYQVDFLGTLSDYRINRCSCCPDSRIFSFEISGEGHGLPAPGMSNQENVAYYSQSISIKGILIKAPGSVSPQALLEAKRIIAMMTEHVRPDILERLVSKQAALAIIPKDQFVTSLPEFSHLSGRIDINGNPYDSFKIRGLGAKRQPVTATSEENLLRLPNDPFKKEDITVHEFAHAIMNLGFAPDDLLKINALYKNALSKGLYPGTFAMSRVDEFWAELTQSFFSVNNEIGGPEQIAEIDNESYRFLEQIYRFSSR
jgi:hypothetical protein